MSDDLERRVRESLRAERLPPAPETLRAFLQRLPADADSIPVRTRPRPAWVAGTLAAAVVVGLLVAVVARTSKPPAASSGPPTGIAWMKVASTGDPALAPDDTVMSAVAFGGGYVMVGNAQRADHAAWWFSPDGRSWERHDADPVFADSLLTQVLRIPDGLLIVGTANRLDAVCAGGVFGCNPVQALRLWTSADGRTWTRLPDAATAVFGRAQLGVVRSGPRGLLAVGAQVPAQGEGHAMLWTSTNGRDWRSSPQFVTAFLTAVIDDAAATSSSFVAVGRASHSGGPTAVGAAWFSADGQTWRQASARGLPELSWAYAAGAGVVGQAIVPSSLWVSRDGTDFVQVGSGGIPFALSATSPVLVSDGTRILAVGRDRATGTDGSWVSTDAETWHKVPQTGTPILGGPGGVGTVGTAGAVLVVTTSIPSGFSSSIWFGAWSSLATPSPVAQATSSPAPSPTPIPPGPHVKSAGVLGPDRGWALTSGGLFLTTDGGSTWRSASVPGPRTDRGVLGVAFADASHGWLATLDSPDPFSKVFDVWRTDDGARTWQRVVVPEGANSSDTMGSVEFSILDPDHLFLLVEGGMPNGYQSDLYQSADGGRTWSADRLTGDRGVTGPFAFADASHGAIAGGPAGNSLFVTADSGRSWRSVAIPIPAGLHPTSIEMWSAPRFWDARRGGLVLTYLTSVGSIDSIELGILLTSDAGASWSVAATMPTPFNALSVAFLSSTDWLLLSDAKTLLHTVDTGRTWSTTAVVGLPSAPGPGPLLMADAQHGWVMVPMSVCLTFKSNCEQRTGLYATSDGGASWSALWPR